MSTEERLQEITIGEPARLDDRIALVEYDSQWRVQFEGEAVRTSARLPFAYAPALESTGYVLRIREPAWHKHRLFKRFDPQVNLHVFSVECEELDRMISFRDRLRSSRADRDLYERTKRELAARRWEYVQDYADAKGAIVEAII